MGQLAAEYSNALAQTQQVSYLTTDHLGSARIITNENGAVTKRQDFSPFGEETVTTHRTNRADYNALKEMRQNYTGYQEDIESGLEYAQARYYNSQLGRFTSVDPLTASGAIKDPQTFNRYSYALNSPYKFTDPLGLLSEHSGSACGTRCQNSGEYVDGSSFRGRDASLDDLKTANELNNEWWAEVERRAGGITDQRLISAINSRAAAPPGSSSSVYQGMPGEAEGASIMQKPIPVNFQIYDWSKNAAGVLSFRARWESNTGNLEDLKECTVGETVVYEGIIGARFKFPVPFPEGETDSPFYSSSPAVRGFLEDNHYTLNGNTDFRKPYSNATVTAVQTYWYSCPYIRGGAYQPLFGPISITRRVEQNREGRWQFTITKLGESAIRQLP